jgi:sterol desaturase/sphingolipid hydroxylase (fatty acid hydroxylase superfamily)
LQGYSSSLLITLLQILTYVLHRYILHSRNNFLARYHQTWYHALPAPFPLTAHYDHPLAYFVGRFIPTYAPAMLFRFHMLTYLMYISVISLEETFAFSGYTVMPTSFFLGGIARRTDMHLLDDAQGNFGPWGVLDWMCGTTVGDSSVEDDFLDEMEEHEIEDKIRKMLEASKRKVKEGAAGNVSSRANGQSSRRRRRE